MAGTTTYYGISYPTNTDYVKDGATAMQTIADGFDSAVAIPNYNNQTGTSYTFVLTDAGKTVTSDNASAVTFTIPPQASVAWANNTTLTVRNLGAGVVTIAGGAGVTVTNTAQTVAQYGEVKLIRTASNAWTVVPASGGASAETVLVSGTLTNGSTAVNFTNLLDSTYKFYRFYIVGSVNTSDQDINIRFRENTTDVTTSYYGGGGRGTWQGTLQSNFAVNNGSTIPFTTFPVGTSADGSATITIYRPDATKGYVTGNYYDRPNNAGGFGGWERVAMTNFTGFTVYPNGQSFNSGYYILSGIK